MTIDRLARRAGLALLALLSAVAAGAGRIATHDPAAQFPDYVLAPPMRPHLVDADGRWRAPFVYPLQIENRLARRYTVDRSHPEPLRWLQAGTLANTAGPPWFPFGTDLLGRDIFARMVFGARLSLSVALLATIGAILLGTLVGGLAGVVGGGIDATLMKGSDAVIALPGIYVALTLRAVLPLVLSTAQVFWCMTMVLAVVAWPIVARGVRAIVWRESRREYAEAARASGATRTRLLLRHLLPATGRFLGVQATLLAPAFITAEATLSFIGLGFNEAAPSWGAMLNDAGQAGTLLEAPWLLLPAAAIAATVVSINLIAGDASAGMPSAIRLK